MSKFRWFLLIAIAAGLALFGREFYPRLRVPIDTSAVAQQSGNEGAVRQLMQEARVAEKARDYPRAVELYSQALVIEPGPNAISRDVLRQRAFAYENLKDFARAETDYAAALTIEPVDPEFYAKRAFYLIRRQRYDEALVDFQTGAKLDPKNSTYALGEGNVYEARGEYKRAIERYSEAIRLDPKIANHYAARGSAYNYADMPKEAYADYDKALQIGYPIPIPRETARLHMGRGYAALQLEQYKAAKDDFDFVLKEVPRASTALAWRGSAHQGLGDRARAIADYKAALAIDPNNKRARDNLKDLETP